MGEAIEAQGVYCSECGEDYTMAYSEERDSVFVVCGCGEAENVGDFVRRVEEKYVADESVNTQRDRMYQ